MQADGAEFLVGNGEMATLIRATDWSGTPLGPIDRWPQSLRTTVSLCLASNFPINIVWGREHTQIYNDGYRVVCGEAHPRALGAGYDVTWASAWPAVGEPFERALSGETSFLENQRMFLTRNGYLEETFFTFSTSPIRDESGGIGGLFHPVTETTATMLAERRTRAVRDLTANLARAEDLPTLLALAVETLSAFDFDLPFALFYEHDADAACYSLAGRYGVPPDTSASPVRIDLEVSEPWPVSEAARDARIVEKDGVASLFDGTPCGPYPEPPSRAFVLPMNVPGVERPPVILVVGASSRLPVDDRYRGFYDLIAAAISAALANVRAREDERRRAEALAAIDRAKTQFFTNVSHEFRTPLTLMLGPLEESLARSENLPVDERERVSLAHRNGLRLLKLVNSLLDFSRIEAGRVRANFEPVDLAALTTDLASNFRSACEKAGLDLVVEVAPLAGPAYVDRDMWEKVVLNLLSNAFKFTLEGGIAVTVGPGPDGAHALVTVADTGLGVPPEELPRLFERFHRVEGTRGRSFEGSGIGLALVRELVRLHGGEITVESVPGQGSAFTVSLPLGRDHLPSEQVLPDPEAPSTATRANAFVEEALRWLPDTAGPPPEPPDAIATTGGHLHRRLDGHVLLADDNADMRGYVRRLLASEGMTVEAVADGEAALAAARRRTPDLILTDVMMPRLDGYGLLRALRRDASLQNTPVVLLSAQAGEEARVEGLDAGADDYLIKPFSARELVSRVATNLDRARERRAAALRESEVRLRLAVEAGRIGEWELDIGSDSSVRAPRHDQIFGYDEPVERWGFETLIGHVLPEDRPAVEVAFRHAAETGTGWNYQCRIRRANDDEVRWIVTRSMPQLDADGRAVKLFGMVQDITDQKLSELRLRDLNEGLERRIAEAVEERGKAEEQLRQAQKMEAVGQLTGGVAHDFNNLLTVIRSSTDLLMRPDLPEARRRRYVGAISDTVDRAAKLTGQLLAFARRQALLPEVFDAGKSVFALSDMIGSLTGSRIRVVVEVSEEPCFIDADPSQFDTAIVNMAVNARDAMDGEGRLTFAVSPVSFIPPARSHPAVSGGFVAVRIEDTGSGIPPDRIERIFEPFFTTKEVGQGTGLGLSQVFGFAKQSGGEIRVESTVGQGSTFELYLPRAEARAEVSSDEPEPLVDGHGTRILVVEDNVEVGSFATQTLAELGYETVWTQNAEEALAELARNADRFDVVFSDVVMPRMNGIDLAQEIRRRHGDLPVVLASGYSHVLAQKGTCGFDLLHKPYSVEQLSRVLRKAGAWKRPRASLNT